MNPVSIIAVCISALTVVVTITIAIVSSTKSDKKDETDAAKEISAAVTDIKNVKEVCEDIRLDVRSMNNNFLGLSREITSVSTETKTNIKNLEKRLDGFEKELREVRAHG